MTVETEERRVLGAVCGHRDALATGDWAGACGRLSASVRRDLAALTGNERGGRAEVLESPLTGVDRQALAADLSGAKLAAMRTEGDRAEVRDPHDRRARWGVEALGGRQERQIERLERARRAARGVPAN